MPSQPATPQEWRLHAVDLHGRGLQVLDKVAAMGDVPTEVAIAGSQAAQAYFTAAQSAIAIATFVGRRP